MLMAMLCASSRSVKRQDSIFAVFGGDDGKLVFPLYLSKHGAVVSPSFVSLMGQPHLFEESARRQTYEAFVTVIGPPSTANLKGFPAFKAPTFVGSDLNSALAAAIRRLVNEAISA
jgi:hypothetical protein